MNEFIQKNKKLLEIYNYLANIIGWILIVLTPVLILILLLNRTGGNIRSISDVNIYFFVLSIHTGIANYLCLGLILLVVARFIKYLYSEEPKPGWLLRHFDKIIYLYTIVIAMGISLEYLPQKKAITWQEILAYSLPVLIINAAKVFILIGLGHVMNKVLPVIEESKSLV